LKIPKGYSECVKQRKTDNIMAKKVQKDNNDLQSITNKTKDRVTNVQGSVVQLVVKLTR